MNNNLDCEGPTDCLLGVDHCPVCKQHWIEDQIEQAMLRAEEETLG